MSEDAQEAVHLLLSIKNWDLSRPRTDVLVSEAKKTFPHADVLATAKSLAFKLKSGVVSYKKPSKAFANWVSSDSERAASRQAHPTPAPRSREITRDGWTDEQRKNYENWQREMEEKRRRQLASIRGASS